MMFKHICFLSVLFLFFSGCIGSEDKTLASPTNLNGENQPTDSKNNMDNNPYFKVISIETWDERDATLESDGDLIYKRDGSYYSRNLETNEEKMVPADYSVSVDGTKATRTIFISDLSRNITAVDCQSYKHISYYGKGETFDVNTGCINVDGKKVAFLADDWGGNNRGFYKSLYYYDMESNKAQKLLSDGRIVSIVGWTNNDEIIFHENTRDVDYISPMTSMLFYFSINENRKYGFDGTELLQSFSISPDGSKGLFGDVNPYIYDFNKKSAKPVNLGVWSDSSKKIASLTNESLIIYNTEDESKQTINYKARENHMQRLVWFKEKVYIIVFAPLVSLNTYKGGDTDYGTVTATFNGRNPTVRYLDMKPGEVAEIRVTVTSKIDNAVVMVTLIEPETKTYTILEGPSPMNQYIYNNSLTAGWSQTYIWKVSPDGKTTDVYAPIDLRVEFSNHEKKYMINVDKYRRKVYFTIANLYIVKK